MVVCDESGPGFGTVLFVLLSDLLQPRTVQETLIASTNFDRLEASAELLLNPAAYDYAAGGAGLDQTVAANEEAFDRVGRPQTTFRPLRTHRN
jgi:hypothetical protein